MEFKNKAGAGLLLLAIFSLIFVAIKYHVVETGLNRLEKMSGEVIAEKVSATSFCATSLYQALKSFPDVKQISFSGSADFPLLFNEGVVECTVKYDKEQIRLVFLLLGHKVYPGNILTKRIIEKMVESYSSKLPPLASIINTFSHELDKIQGTCTPNVINAVSLDSYKIK